MWGGKSGGGEDMEFGLYIFGVFVLAGLMSPAVPGGLLAVGIVVAIVIYPIILAYREYQPKKGNRSEHSRNGFSNRHASRQSQHDVNYHSRSQELSLPSKEESGVIAVVAVIGTIFVFFINFWLWRDNRISSVQGFFTFMLIFSVLAILLWGIFRIIMFENPRIWKYDEYWIAGICLVFVLNSCVSLYAHSFLPPLSFEKAMQTIEKCSLQSYDWDIIEDWRWSCVEDVKRSIERNKELLEQTNEEGISLFQMAINHRHFPLILFFIKKGLDPNATDEAGNTFLHMIAQPVNDKERIFVENEEVDLIKSLTILGANVNIRNREGKTPVFMAMENGNLQILKILLGNGANADIPDKTGTTPLQHVVHYEKCPYTAISELLEAGADPNVKNIHGNSLLFSLLSKKSYSNHISDVIHALVDAGANINEQNQNGDTPLHLSLVECDEYSYKTAKALLAAGANTDIKNHNGDSPNIEMIKKYEDEQKRISEQNRISERNKAEPHRRPYKTIGDIQWEAGRHRRPSPYGGR